jgi:hypothetical protein
METGPEEEVAARISVPGDATAEDAAAMDRVID